MGKEVAKPEMEGYMFDISRLIRFFIALSKTSKLDSQKVTRFLLSKESRVGSIASDTTHGPIQPIIALSSGM